MKSDETYVEQVFCHLTVLEDLGMVENGSTHVKRHMVRCRCDCGTVKDYILANLKDGKTKSCGCGGNKPEPLIGQRFGCLTVLAEIEPRVSTCNGKPVKQKMVHCRCDCGTELDVSVGNLKRGITKSCGCIRRGAKRNRYVKTNYEQFYGQKIGHLEVLGKGVPKKYNSNGTVREHATLHCRCDCGNEIDVLAYYIFTNKVTTCGKNCKGIFNDK